MAEPYYSIRCPTCLATNSVNKNIAVNKIISCISCKRGFAFKDALAQKSEQKNATKDITVDAFTIVDSVGNVFWIIAAVGIITLSLIARFYVDDMDGPEFLWFYMKLFVGLIIISSMTRWFWKDIIAVSLIGFILFEFVAVLRLIDGLLMGMRNFWGMAIFMVVGGLLFFVRAHHVSSLSSDGDCSSGSGGCGGGCGGCGG